MKVPMYTQQHLPTAIAGTPKSLAGEKSTAMKIPNTEAQIYNALKQTGDRLFNIGTQIAKAEDVTEYNNAVVELKEGYADIKNDLVTNPAYNEFSVTEFEEKNTELSTQLQTDVMGKLTKYNAKKQTTIAAREMGVSSRVTAQTVGHAKFIDRSRAESLKNLDKLKNSFIASGDVKDLAYAEGVITSSVSAGIFNKQEAVAISKKFTDNAISGYYENLMMADPVTLYNDIIRDENPPKEWEALSEEYQTNLTKKLKTAYNQKMDSLKIDAIGTWQNMSIDKPITTWEAFKKIPKRSFDELFNDAEYARLKKSIKNANDSAIAATKSDIIDPVLKGRLDRGLKDALVKVENVGIQPAGIEEAIMDVYGNNAKTRRKGQAVLEKYRAEAQLGFGKYAVKKDIQNGNVAANAEFLKDIKPTVGSHDFSNRQIIFNSAVKEFNKKIDTMGTDPKKLFDEYFPAKRPSSLEPAIRIKENKAYMDGLTNWYIEQGLPKSQWKVMTKDEASAFADSVPNKPTDEIIKDVISIQEQYRDKADIAFRDLSAEGFPVELRLIAELNKKQLPTVGRDLANAYKLKEADFAKALGVEAKDVRMNINELINSTREITDFEASVYSTGTTSNNIKKVADIKNAVRKLSYIYKMKNMDENAAVEKATQSILGGRFNYIEDNKMTLRIPTKYDQSLAEDAMDSIKDNLTVKNLSSRYGDNVHIKDVRKSSYWKNVGGNDQLVILVDLNGLPLLDKENNPMTLNLGNSGDVIAGKKSTSEIHKIPKRGI